MNAQPYRMNAKLYRTLVYIAILMTMGWVGWSFWDSFGNTDPGVREYMAGNHAFEDGQYEKALAAFDESLEIAPGKGYTINMKATTLLQMGRNAEALEGFDEVLAMEPNFAGGYALRGILYDRMEQYEKALADYDRALSIESEDLDGPKWLTRFMRNQSESPPTIKERAGYLRAQFALPESERVLKNSEIDSQQRSYKVD